MGDRRHVVRRGECTSSIAYRYGHHPQTLLEHPDNAELAHRRDPNVLREGDVLLVPAKEIREESAAIDAVHRFRRKAVPERLRVRLLDLDEPRAGVAYALVIDGVEIQGVTDGDGWLEHPIAPNARRGSLVVDEEVYELLLGHLDPVEHDGLEHRLRNLGYMEDAEEDLDDAVIDRDELDDEEEPAPLPRRVRRALERFQYDCELEVTGMLDDATRAELEGAHGS